MSVPSCPWPMTVLPILYSFRRCPYAMRARMALLASGQSCEIREVKLSAKPPELAAASPKATVPVLCLPDGRVLDESLDIMRWALGRSDPEAWLGRDDPALIAANDGPFKHHLDRYKYPERHGSDAEVHRSAGMDMLLALEARLASRPYLCGDRRGFADIAIFPFVRQFAETDRGWFDAQPLPAVAAWLAGLTESDLFTAIMVRLAPWKASDAPVSFPA
ncbi:glutathione S-transferase [Rhizorhabdus phycosphaerae]|uniref:glutathione S-transferase n=1 Tax=Rhizorhabdus phycosphaerae TaxID=2711156 RepID=UPI001D022BD2|nr:glutathione S-transferase [Rhizorhabdus phycosphaerae]